MKRRFLLLPTTALVMVLACIYLTGAAQNQDEPPTAETVKEQPLNGRPKALTDSGLLLQQRVERRLAELEKQLQSLPNQLALVPVQQLLDKDLKIELLQQQVDSLKGQVEVLQSAIQVSSSGVLIQGNSVTILASQGDIALDAADDLSLTAQDDVNYSLDDRFKIEAGRVEIDATASVDVDCSVADFDCGATDFSGVLQSATLITNSVISSTYTPGAGNIW